MRQDPEPEGSLRNVPTPGAPSLLGPIHAFGSGCFFVFGVIYLVFVHSRYMFLSNVVFGGLGVLSWFALRDRAPHAVRASVFLAIVYVGLVNVAVHLGVEPIPMVFWGMSISIAAAFMYELAGVLAWVALTLAFYPLTHALKNGVLADRVILLDAAQTDLLSFASYAGLLSFLAFTFVLFRRRLDRALGVLNAQAVELRKSESFLAESQLVARIGSYDWDVARGTWTCSTLLNEIFGIDASFRRDFPGFLELVHPDDRAEMARYVEQEVLVPGGVFDREYRLARRENGREVWVHGRGVVYRGLRGEPLRMVGTIQDISGLKHAEDARRQLESRLYHAQKLESLGVLAGGIAHDFNNLLTGILGNITLARSGLRAVGSEPVRLLQQAETAALRAAELTRQMLAFSGKGQFVIGPLDLNATLTEMVDLLKVSIPKMVEMRFDLDPCAPRVLADASQIRQVVMNLIINAAEAIGDVPGVIRIRSGLRTVDEARVATGYSGEPLEPGRYACIEIADTGCGMSPETQARLFDPFFTTKFTGRGLGLAAVLGIVKGHRGAIWLDSEPGKGATFTVLLPCAADDALVTPPPLRAPPPEGVSGCVLIIDDEPAVRDVAGSALAAAGFRVLEAADGDGGIATFRERGTAIDVVLLDLTMPRKGGVEVFGELKRLRPDLRVVLMSGYTRGNVVPLFSDSVPDDFLEKPFRHEDLVAAVRGVLYRP